MREIKFRAWQTVTKTMFYNIEKGTGDTYNSNPPFADYLENSHMVVMQYTGLKDKQGREVYEGDIVKGETSDMRHIGTVEYDEQQVLQPFHTVSDYDGNYWMDCLVGGFEIVGNIYENAGLIRDDK